MQLARLTESSQKIVSLEKKMRLDAALAVMLLLLPPVSCLAQVDKYHVTDAEKAACTPDAMRLCSQTYPNEDQLFACMKQNRGSLSQTCRVAFDAGVKRRRL